MTKGSIIPGLALLICGWWSARETSNLRIRATRNACISMILSKSQFSASRGEQRHKRHSRESPPDAAPNTSGECTAERVTDQHSTVSSTLRAPNVQVPIHPNGRVNLLVHFEPPLRSKHASIWTPQILVSVMRENNDMSAPPRRWGRINEMDAQVVSVQRDSDESSFGNGQFGVHPPGSANDRFRERHDVIFYGFAQYFYSNGIEPQGFLCEE